MGTLVGAPAQIHIASAKALTSGGAQLAKFDTITYDPGDQIIDTAGWRQFQCQYAGWYLCIVSICLELAAGASGALTAQIYQNGASVGSGNTIAEANAATGFPISTVTNIIPAALGDVLEPALGLTGTTHSLWNDARLTYATFAQWA